MLISLRVPRKSPGKRLRVRVNDKISVTLEKMRTGLLMGPCQDPASNGLSKKTRYEGRSRDAELPILELPGSRQGVDPVSVAVDNSCLALHVS